MLLYMFQNNNLFLKWENSVIGEIKPDYSVVLRHENMNSIARAYFKDKNILSTDKFKSFLLDRIISKDRKDINNILARIGMREYDVFSIARSTRAFNLADKFWIAYSEKEEYETTFIAVFRDLYKHNLNSRGDSIASPSGCNVKQYIFYNKEFGIVKYRMHPYSTDAINEVIAYRLGKLFNIDCCYANMVSSDAVFSKYEYDYNKEYLIHARNIVNGEVLSLDNYEYIINTYFKESTNSIIKMILFDFIINQDDRHMSNWGVLMDLQGNKHMYKLYDNGRSLFYESDEEMAKASLLDPVSYSNSFGLIGSYYDVVKDIASKYSIGELINLNVNIDEIKECFSGFEKFPKWKKEACVCFILWALEVLKGFCEHGA